VHAGELNLHTIESIILRLAHLTGHPETEEAYWQQYHGFAHQHKDRSNHLSTEEWTDVIDALQALLDATEECPDCSTVIDVHKIIGTIYHQKLNNQGKATECFLKALWVEKHTEMTRKRLLENTPHQRASITSRGAA
jgi:hypothetical protein